MRTFAQYYYVVLLDKLSPVTNNVHRACMNILMNIRIMEHNTVVTHHTSRVESLSAGNIATREQVLCFHAHKHNSTCSLLPPLYNVRTALKARIVNGQLLILCFRDYYV